MNRSENMHRLASETFDLCIIGGGASGAGCALDAALRGLKVALIEKTDFAAETSSRSTKLVHGGVRYLEQAFKKFDFAQLRQVQHGLNERRIVLQNAPHLAQPLGLLTPVFSWWEGFYYSVGLKMYDWFAGLGSNRLPKSRWLSKREALKKMPGISPNIHSAVLYYDGQMDDSRYCLALVQSASEQGAVVANHLELVDFQKDASGKILSAVLKDTLEDAAPFTLKATQFLNCTGPYADPIRLLANPVLTPRIRPSKGVHLVLSGETVRSKMAMLIPKTRDGRMVFAIPFEGNLLLGTTDEPYRDLAAEPTLNAREIDFLLETLQPFVAQALDKSQVKSGFGGIRPLLAPASQINPGSTNTRIKQTKSLLRDHELEQDAQSGLLSLLGGKWTTYRLMAQDAVDAVCRKLEVLKPCQTEQYRLAGAEAYTGDLWKKIQEDFGFDEDICQHLAAKYGSRANLVATLTKTNPVLGERILPPFSFLKAEIVYAVQHEMALTLRDFLARRIRLEIMDWDAAKKAAPVVAKWMGETLNWNETAKKARIAAYIALLDGFQKTA